MSNDKDYPTDEFGRPNGRDYHYRIPLNDDKAVKLASLALKGMCPYKDRFVVKWDNFSGDKISYMGLKTHDSKGHLDGLAEYAHSPKWQNLGPMSEIDEYRSGRSGGTKIKGSFRVDPQSFCGITQLTFETTISQTPTELENAYETMGDTWTDIRDAIHWAKQEAMELAREQIADRQQSCDHNSSVFPDNFVGEHMNSAGYCEDCGAEITEDKELAY